MVQEIRYLVRIEHVGTERYEKIVWIVHEYDDRGWHRLTWQEVKGGETVVRIMMDNWTGYEQISEFKHSNGKLYLGFTDYFGERVIEGRSLVRPAMAS